MKLPIYREAHAHNSATPYNFTNEEPELFAKMLAGRTFKKAGSICSGGEVAFGVILPRAEELFAIDHSNGSIAAAFLKAAIMQMVGVKELKKILTKGIYDDLLPHIVAAHTLLPAELQKCVKIEKPKSTYDPSYYSAPIFKNDFANYRREWTYLSDAALEDACAKMDKVVAIHGDIMDLTADGPYDLLYTSNASEHSNRQQRQPRGDDFVDLLAPGGLLMCALGCGTAQLTGKGLKLIERIGGYRTSWSHQLYEKSN